MNIIPQNIKIEAKKILENVTESIFSRNIGFLSDLFTSHLSCISLLTKLKEMILQIYQNAITLIDQFFLESEHRKKHYYKSSVQTRTIITLFGELQFDRTYYVDKNKENGFFFIDDLFHFEAYTTYDPVVRSIFIDRSVESNPNNSSTNSNLNLFHLNHYLANNVSFSLPRQTIYNWIHTWNLQKVEYNYYDEDCKNLYVMVDEKWIHEQIRLATLSDEERKKRHYIMSKCFVTFTGAKTKNNRTALGTFL